MCKMAERNLQRGAWALLDPFTQNNTQSETLSAKYAIFTCFHSIIFDVCSCDNFMCGHSIPFHQVTK